MNKKLQVFVSSTYTDLKEERQAAVEAILDAGHIPAGMELFKAGNRSQLETIYKWIDESDVYMLILGGRYGSIEEESGLSYTELEYRYALSKSMPVFAIVLSESFLTSKINILGLEHVIEQNNNDKYILFKKFVISKIIRKSDDCKDIQMNIVLTLNEFIDQYDLSGWIRGNYIKNNNDEFDNLTKVFKHIKAYEDSNLHVPVSYYEYFMQYGHRYIDGVFQDTNADQILYKYYSEIFYTAGIIDKIINETSNPMYKMTKFGFEYYKYIISNQL